MKQLKDKVIRRVSITIDEVVEVYSDGKGSIDTKNKIYCASVKTQCGRVSFSRNNQTMLWASIIQEGCL